jgi:hypothetical protein
MGKNQQKWSLNMIEPREMDFFQQEIIRNGD